MTDPVSPRVSDRESDHAGRAVVAREVTVLVGDVLALDGVDLTVDAGEFVAVVGPSGAGKTTLLRALTGELLPELGTVRLDGEPVLSRADTVRRGVSLIPQGNALVSTLTAFESCAVALPALGVARRDVAERVDEALTAVGLAESGNHLVDELSGGQQQRVAVARVLASRPRCCSLTNPPRSWTSASAPNAGATPQGAPSSSTGSISARTRTAAPRRSPPARSSGSTTRNGVWTIVHGAHEPSA